MVNQEKVRSITFDPDPIGPAPNFKPWKEFISPIGLFEWRLKSRYGKPGLSFNIEIRMIHLTQERNCEVFSYVVSVEFLADTEERELLNPARR